MNLGVLLAESWRISWRFWQLWLLNLLLFLVFLPAGGLSLLLTGAAYTLPFVQARPELRGLVDAAGLARVPAAAWISLGLAGFVILVVTTALALLLQAAAARGAALAAEHGRLRLADTLRLGRQRVMSLLKLSATFGAAIAALSVLPRVAVLLLQERSPAGAAWISRIETGLGPLNALLGLALFFGMLAVAMDDLRPRAAFRQAWRVLRLGWWGFLVVAAVLGLPAVVLVLLGVPVALLMAVGLTVFPEAPRLWLVLVALAYGAAGLAVILFTAVYSVTLNALIYRAAARLAGPLPQSA